MRRIRFADEQMSQQCDSSPEGQLPSLSNLSVKFDAVTELQRDEQTSRQDDSSRRGHCPSISNLMSVKLLQRTASTIDSASSHKHATTIVSVRIYSTLVRIYVALG